MTNEEIRYRLESMTEEKYKDFSQALIPGCRPMLGVRIPKQRALAKEIAKGDWESYLRGAVDASFEEVNIQGFVIGYAKGNYDKVFPYIVKHVEKIDDWSLCDGFCATLKIVNKNREEFFRFLKEYANNDSEFKQRFVAVMLMDYFLDDEYIDRTLVLLDSLKNQGYYCKMGVAWAIATAFAKQRDKTLKYLEHDNTLDDFTFNKAIQKMRESYRVSDEDKELLKRMKKYES